MAARLRKFIRIWFKLVKNSFQITLINRSTVFIFTIAKLIRLVLFFLFLVLLLKQARSLAGYNLHQAMFFYLTFNLIDTLGQFLFREVYRFRQLIVSGDLDLVLVKPFNPLYRCLLAGADLMDLIMLVPIFGATVYVGINYITTNPYHWLLYLSLVLSGLIISAAIHIFVLAFSITTIGVDHAIMIYRDLTAMARIPIDLYSQPLRGLITYIIPVGIIMTFPAKALMGLLSPFNVFLSFVLALTLIVISYRLWLVSLKKYSSASS